jgi:hypothetical protein
VQQIEFLMMQKYQAGYNSAVMRIIVIIDIYQLCKGMI